MWIWGEGVGDSQTASTKVWRHKQACHKPDRQTGSAGVACVWKEGSLPLQRQGNKMPIRVHAFHLEAADVSLTLSIVWLCVSCVCVWGGGSDKPRHPSLYVLYGVKEEVNSSSMEESSGTT